MILPDVNVLVYAFRREAEGHDCYASWLAEVVTGGEELALLDASLIGFLRIVTNRRVFATPAPADLALGFVTRLRNGARARWLPTGAPSWDRLDQLAAQDRGIAGNLVPDAHLAAVALAHGCRLATADRGFARFPGLDWFDPAGLRSGPATTKSRSTSTAAAGAVGGHGRRYRCGPTAGGRPLT